MLSVQCLIGHCGACPGCDHECHPAPVRLVAELRAVPAGETVIRP